MLAHSVNLRMYGIVLLYKKHVQCAEASLDLDRSARWTTPNNYLLFSSERISFHVLHEA